MRLPFAGPHVPLDGVAVADTKRLRDAYILDQVRAAGGITGWREQSRVGRPLAGAIEPLAWETPGRGEAGDDAEDRWRYL
jgi:hypothetical protein